MPKILVLADDLTGAADCAAAFLGRAKEVRVALHAKPPSGAAVTVIDLNTRSRPERAARALARRAFYWPAAKRAQILYKKIDSTLKGHVAAELSAIRWSLGRRAVILAPAFPAQGRVTRGGRLYLHGTPSSPDLRSFLSRAGLPATLVDIGAVRGNRLAADLRAAIATGAQGLACEAETDADLERIAQAGLALRPRPLFVGSAGLARALARTLPRRKAAPRGPVPVRPVLTVVGSAAPISRTQARKLKGPVLRLDWTREPTRKDLPRVRRLGRKAARSGKSHFVVTGGETARAVLAACGIKDYRLLGEVEPGVPFGVAADGTLVCTKAGAFGRPDTLARCVARLEKEMRRT